MFITQTQTHYSTPKLKYIQQCLPTHQCKKVDETQKQKQFRGHLQHSLGKSFNKFKDNNNKSHKVMKSCLRPSSSHHRNFQKSAIDFDFEKRNMNKKLSSKGYSQTIQIFKRPTGKQNTFHAGDNDLNKCKDLAFQKSKSSTLHKRSSSTFSYLHFSSTPIVSAQTKWTNTLQLYQMQRKMTKCFQQKLKPGISFYKFLLDEQALQKHPLRVNFPHTMIMDNDGFYQLIYTDGNGYIKNRILVKDQFFTEMEKDALQFSQKLKAHFGKRIYNQCDYNENPNAPILIIKCADDQQLTFETQIQTYKTFLEKKPKPTRNKLLQRYIYGRNMKSMIFRHCYQKCEKGEQREQIFGYRFQNNLPIFRKNKKTDANQIHKLTSTIQLSFKRMNSLQYSKITNKNGLQKYNQQASNLKRFIEKFYHIKIVKLYIDFIVDLFDVPWIVNIKYLETEKQENVASLRQVSQYIITTATCKLCSNIYPKEHVKKVLSTRMIYEFLQHLQKRIKTNDLCKVKFIKQVNINLKQHKTCHACQCCYNMVMEQLQLRNCEKQLAKICNIYPKDQFSLNSIIERPAQLQNELKQWRLMIYMVQIRNLDFNNISIGFGKDMKNNNDININGSPIDRKKKGAHRTSIQKPIQGTNNMRSHNLNSEHLGDNSMYGKNQTQSQNLFFNYKLGTGVQERWKINPNTNMDSDTLLINKLKIHYLYTPADCIDKFLKNTQIGISLIKGDEQNPIVNGSTGILSHFKNRFPEQCGQRQTSTVLLFFQNGKYCELTIKVGLVCDGIYNTADMNLYKQNNVYFPDRNFINSNTFPKEWMEIFTQDYQPQIHQKTYEDIYKKINPKTNKKLKKKSYI